MSCRVFHTFSVLEGRGENHSWFRNHGPKTPITLGFMVDMNVRRHVFLGHILDNKQLQIMAHRRNPNTTCFFSWEQGMIYFFFR